MALRKCRHDGKCCMRDKDGMCLALETVIFRDGKCHFRKEDPDGVNMYDKWRKEKK